MGFNFRSSLHSSVNSGTFPPWAWPVFLSLNEVKYAAHIGPQDMFLRLQQPIECSSPLDLLLEPFLMQGKLQLPEDGADPTCTNLQVLGVLVYSEQKSLWGFLLAAVHASFSPGLTLPASAAVSLQVEVPMSLPIPFVQVPPKSQARAKHCSPDMA